VTTPLTNKLSRALPEVSLDLKALFTGYILVVSIGLLVAGAQILLTHGMADGEFGLSVDDVVYSYYGNRGDSRLESKLNGSMKDKANVADRTRIIRWVHDGSPEAQWENGIREVFQENCTSCHGTIPGLPDFTNYGSVTRLSKVDTGASIDSLTRVSHIHLFGIAFIFFFIGFIFSFTRGIQPGVKAALIVVPFLFLILDVAAWWMTKWYPSFAWATLVGGFVYMLASGFMLLASLYQMWVMRPVLD